VRPRHRIQPLRLVPFGVIAGALALSSGCDRSESAAPLPKPSPGATPLSEGMGVAAPSRDRATLEGGEVITIPSDEEIARDPNWVLTAEDPEVEAIREDQAAYDAANPPYYEAEALRRTFWYQAASGADFQSIRFMDTAVTITQAGGESVTFPADYSATHVACSGFPVCVLTITPDGDVVPFFFAVLGGMLAQLDCFSSIGQNPEAWQAWTDELRETQGGDLIYDSEFVVCANALGVPYVPVEWWYAAPVVALEEGQHDEQ